MKTLKSFQKLNHLTNMRNEISKKIQESSGKINDPEKIIPIPFMSKVSVLFDGNSKLLTNLDVYTF